MASDPFNSVAAELREALRGACKATFGSAPVEMIAPVGGGASGAHPFRVQIGGRRYPARLGGPASPLRNPHQYEAMRIASAAGIAPHIHYIDEANRIAITDFVDELSLSN